MPGLRYEIEDVVADGDRVVVAYTLHARVNERDDRGARRDAVRRRRRRAASPGASTTGTASCSSARPAWPDACSERRPRAQRDRGRRAGARHDDVRRAGAIPTADACRGWSTSRSTPASTCSTPPTSTTSACPRRSSARRSRGRRDRVVLATKVGNAMSDDPAERGLSRRWIARLVRRQPAPPRHRPHRPLPDAPPRPGHAARRDAGRVRRSGARRARSAPSARRRSRPSSSTSCSGSPRDRGWIRADERAAAVLDPRAAASSARCCPTCRRHDVGVLVWAPLNGGWLTGKYQLRRRRRPRHGRAREPDHFDHRDAEMRAAQAGLVDRLAAVAAEAGLTLSQLALGFARRQPGRHGGAARPAHAGAAHRSCSTRRPAPLAPDVLAAIDAIVPPGTNVNPADAA